MINDIIEVVEELKKQQSFHCLNVSSAFILTSLTTASTVSLSQSYLPSVSILFLHQI